MKHDKFNNELASSSATTSDTVNPESLKFVWKYNNFNRNHCISIGKSTIPASQGGLKEDHTIGGGAAGLGATIIYTMYKFIYIGCVRLNFKTCIFELGITEGCSLTVV